MQGVSNVCRKNDIPIRLMKQATAQVGITARNSAFAAGVAITYAKEGKLLEEQPDGSIQVLDDVTVSWHVPATRRWTLPE
jgi:hypothetical protein